MSLLQNTIIVVITAIIVGIVIPLNFKQPLPVPEIFGTVAPGFEEVKEVFRKNYEDGTDNREGGSAFSVYQEGKKVVDLWAGYADLEANRIWREDTMTMVFSTMKSLAALCVAMLVDRGQLDFKKPVSHYWPQFAQNGKENITVEQLLEHEAGLFVLKSPLTFDLLRNHTELDKVLAETGPAWKPGTRHGYHGTTMGPYVDALVRRVDPKKRTIGRFFEQEVRKPFDVDAYIAVPLELDYRIGRLILLQPTVYHALQSVLAYDLAGRTIISILWSVLFGAHDVSNSKIFENCKDVCDFNRQADPEVRTVEFASAFGVASASGLAKLFGILANGGKEGNKTLLSEDIINEYINDKRGLTPDLVWFDHPSRWKYGMNILPQTKGGNLFGAVGIGGQFGFADPNNKLGYGFVSRYLTPITIEEDSRVKRLRASVLRAIKNQKRDNLRTDVT